MPFKILKKKSSFFIACGLIFTFIIGIAAGYFSAHGITENGKFEAFTQEVFRNEVSGSSLTLHYSLAHPEKQGIRQKSSFSWHGSYRYEEYLQGLSAVRG